MTMKQVVEQTVKHLLKQENGTSLSVWGAIKSACPNAPKLDEDDLFTLTDQIMIAANKAGLVLDYSAHEGMAEGLPFNLDFVIWHKNLKKVRILSDLLCYGPMPEPGEPIEQRLTISESGRVWFSEYGYTNEYPFVKTLTRKCQTSIGKDKAAAILSLIYDFLTEGEELCRATDVGDWYITATLLDGKALKETSSMDGDPSIRGVDLTNFIRESIPIENLAAFRHLDEDIDETEN